MKKIIFILVCVFSISVFSQEKITEGIVKSKQTMSSDNEQMQAQLAMMGETLTTTYFKGNNTRSETFNLMTGNVITVIDGAKKEMLMMMDNQSGKKYMVKSMKANKEDQKNITVEKGDETKTILGYVCQEYNMTVTKGGVTINVDLYVTDKVSALSQQVAQMGAEVEGYPMYMVMNVSQSGRGLTITHEVTEINKADVSDDKFDMTPLEGYTKTEQLLGM